ncbi:MAG: ASPIC/UnbV domain-containing protein, partial [Myxococcota bacterium]
SGASDCYEDPHPRLFENLATDSNFLQLELWGGEGTNRAAIGARVEVRTGDVLQVQEVNGGGGQFGDQTELLLHFGLGEACEAEVAVRWPDATLSEETFTLGGGYRYRIVQFTGEAEVVPLP